MPPPKYQPCFSIKPMNLSVKSSWLMKGCIENSLIKSFNCGKAYFVIKETKQQPIRTSSGYHQGLKDDLKKVVKKELTLFFISSVLPYVSWLHILQPMGIIL